MMKKLVTVVILLFTLLFITNVNAAECTYNEVKNLKALAKKIEIVAIPKIEEGDAFVDVSLYNLNKYFYVLVQDMNYIPFSKTSTYVGSYTPGSSIKIIVYASSKTNCIDEKLYSTKVKLPSFNKYSLYDECKQNEKKNICRKWYDSSNVSEEQFKAFFKTTNKKEESFFEKILDFIKNNVYWGVAFIVFIIIVIIVLVVTKKKKKEKVMIDL